MKLKIKQNNWNNSINNNIRNDSSGKVIIKHKILT